MKNTSLRRHLSVLAVLAAVIAISPAVSLGGIWASGIGFDITPTSPTTLDDIVIEAFATHSDTSLEIVSQSYSIDGNDITMELTLHAEMGFQIFWDYGMTLPLGLLEGKLDEGTYNVYANFNIDNYAPLGTLSGSTSFTVVPEPATLSILGLGSLALIRKRK